jgi:hypothetical protein
MPTCVTCVCADHQSPERAAPKHTPQKAQATSYHAAKYNSAVACAEAEGAAGSGGSVSCAGPPDAISGLSGCTWRPRMRSTASVTRASTSVGCGAAAADGPGCATASAAGAASIASSAAGWECGGRWEATRMAVCAAIAYMPYQCHHQAQAGGDSSWQWQQQMQGSLHPPPHLPAGQPHGLRWQQLSGGQTSAWRAGPAAARLPMCCAAPQHPGSPDQRPSGAGQVPPAPARRCAWQEVCSGWQRGAGHTAAALGRQLQVNSMVQATEQSLA